MKYLKFILLLIVGIGTGCKSQDTPFLQLISAEKEHWFGGVNGVEGYNFTIRIAPLKNDKVEFLKLNWKGKSLPVETQEEENYIEVKATYSMNRNQPQLSMSSTGEEDEIPEEIESEEKITYLTFKIKNKIDTLKIPKFVEKKGNHPLFP